MVEKVGAYCDKYRMAEAGETVVVGVSGGVDSMVLLYVLLQLAEKRNLRLVVVHVNHGLRGVCADADEALVRTFCEAHALRFLAVRVPVAEMAAREKIGVEEAGRHLRYQAFLAACHEVGAKTVAVAHHADDSAETALFHLLRGTGLSGLSGIRPVTPLTDDPSVSVVRPLLGMRRAEILAYAVKHAIPYREDASNDDVSYRRNYIRKVLVPAMEEVNAQAVRHILAVTEEAAEAEAFWKETVDAAYRQTETVCGDTPALSLPVLTTLVPVLQREIVLRWLRTHSGKERDWSRLHVEDVLALSQKQTGRFVTLPYGVTVMRVYDCLCFWRCADAGEDLQTEETDWSLVCPVPGSYALADGAGMVTLSLLQSVQMPKFLEKIPKNRYTKWFDYDKIGQELSLRSSKEGDFFVFDRKGNKKSAKKLFQEYKIPAMMRARVPLLAAGSRILWMIGYRAEEGASVDAQTKQILQAVWTPANKGETDEGDDSCTDL